MREKRKTVSFKLRSNCQTEGRIQNISSKEIRDKRETTQKIRNQNIQQEHRPDPELEIKKRNQRELIVIINSKFNRN